MEEHLGTRRRERAELVLKLVGTALDLISIMLSMKALLGR